MPPDLFGQAAFLFHAYIPHIFLQVSRWDKQVSTPNYEIALLWYLDLAWIS